MIFPESASTQRAKSSFASGVPVVSQICFPQITGDDHARPWIGVFHFTFWFALHVSGSLLPSAWPSPLGPRNCGQLEARAAEQKISGNRFRMRMAENSHTAEPSRKIRFYFRLLSTKAQAMPRISPAPCAVLAIGPRYPVKHAANQMSAKMRLCRSRCMPAPGSKRPRIQT